MTLWMRWGALLLAAPLVFLVSELGAGSPQHSHGAESGRRPSSATHAGKNRAAFLLRFQLNETQAQIVKLMGPPERAAESGSQHVCLQYHLGEDTHDPTHSFCFGKSDGRLVSVSLNAEHPENVDALLPPASTGTYYWPDSEKREYSARVRSFGKLDRLFIANGVSKPGDATSHVLLVRRSALRAFVPWLHDQMSVPSAVAAGAGSMTRSPE